MEAQSVLPKYTILLNWEKEKTTTQFKVLKLNTPTLKPILVSPQYGPPTKWKTSTPPQKNFWEQKSPTPRVHGGGRHESIAYF